MQTFYSLGFEEIRNGNHFTNPFINASKISSSQLIGSFQEILVLQNNCQDENESVASIRIKIYDSLKVSSIHSMEETTCYLFGWFWNGRCNEMKRKTLNQQDY